MHRPLAALAALAPLILALLLLAVAPGVAAFSFPTPTTTTTATRFTTGWSLPSSRAGLRMSAGGDGERGGYFNRLRRYARAGIVIRGVEVSDQTAADDVCRARGVEGDDTVSVAAALAFLAAAPR